MIGHEFEAIEGEPCGIQWVDFVRALGQHRYVQGRLHLVHAFVVAAAAEGEPRLDEAAAWAAGVLADPAIDQDSRDERLFRRASDAELVAALGTFWIEGERTPRARARLQEHLARIGVHPDQEERLPFDESCEEDVYPVLIDAGWELLPLAALEPERHKGARAAFEDFEVARFEEENTIPPVVTLHELPVMGAVELLRPFDEAGAARAPFVLWANGHETYLDYVYRGVARAVENSANKRAR
jgi:hypothetical protein